MSLLVNLLPPEVLASLEEGQMWVLRHQLAAELTSNPQVREVLRPWSEKMLSVMRETSKQRERG